MSEGEKMDGALEKRPGILIVGSPNVGKRSLLSRLLSVDFEDASDSSSDVLKYGWTINTKYYTADVSVWMAELNEDLSIGSVPNYDELAALVMVFDLNDLSSLAVLKDWVSCTDIQKFDILLCIGNKVDLLPGHPAHVEYRRCLQKLENTSFDPDFSDFGISETEGVSLLGDEDSSLDIKTACWEWCTEHGIEYIEACATNMVFDKCLCIDGDSQGVERLLGALSAHMWPGMILKSGDKITEPSLPENQELSEEESDYEFEYEVLSGGSAEPWDDINGGWVSAAGPVINTKEETRSVGGEENPSSSMAHSGEKIDDEAKSPRHFSGPSEPDKGPHYEFEDLEQLMSEIGNMRDSLRLMPDFQRREMAANLALKMAAMFGDSSGDEGLD